MRQSDSTRVGLWTNPPAPTYVPDQSQWDETTCNLAVCQHPQCWAAVRRIERGRPRLLGPPCKTSKAEDKLPTLTVVNLSDVYIPACRLTRRRPPPRLALHKPCSLRPQGPAFGSKFSGRPRKALLDKDFISATYRAPQRPPLLRKLPVLNLNDTQLPDSQDLENMVVFWVPEAPGNQVMLTKRKQFVFSQKVGKNLLPERPVSRAGKKSRPESRSRNVPPPPSPVYFSEPGAPGRFVAGTLQLLRDLSSRKAKTKASSEVALRLEPVGKSRPDSAALLGMFLSIHGLTLQAPAMRYPLSRFYYNPRARGQRKPQQTQPQPPEKVKPPEPQKQEAMQPSMSVPASESSWPSAGSCLLLDEELFAVERESTRSPSQGMELLEPSESKEMEHQEFQDSFLGMEVTGEKLPVQSVTSEGQLLETEVPLQKAVSSEVEVVLKVHKSLRRSLATWNPDLRLLRILQDKDDVEGDHESEYASECASVEQESALSPPASKGSWESLAGGRSASQTP